MRALIVGNMGYVGSVLVRHLRREYPHYQLYGLDNGYFRDCLVDAQSRPETSLDKELTGDIRLVTPQQLEGFDTVVLLAAVSNDPMGKEFEAATNSINVEATLNVARSAQEAGITNLVFASSCSVYGTAQGGPRREEDPVEPLTAYARSKIAAEEGLQELNGSMAVTALRFATACGISDRLRLDLVLNEFVAAAIADGAVEVLSDGTPWRPLIDVADMALAIDWAMHRAVEGDQYLVLNTGSSKQNYRVREIAEAVAEAVPGAHVNINTQAPVDSRSYQVDFSRFERLAPRHVPRLNLQESIANLVALLEPRRDQLQRYRTLDLIRLNVLRDHISKNRLSAQLEWIGS